MLQRKIKSIEIPAEKMALLAEKGLHKARLSHAEKMLLAENGLSEFYSIKESIKTPVPSIDQQTVENLIALYFLSSAKKEPGPAVMDVSVRMADQGLKVLSNAGGWFLHSPVFAQRGNESDSISFFKEAGKYTIHMGIVGAKQQRFNITVILTGKSKKGFSFEVTLFQNGRCIESIHLVKNSEASFSSVLPGNYSLKISEKKSEILSTNIGLEE